MLISKWFRNYLLGAVLISLLVPPLVHFALKTHRAYRLAISTANHTPQFGEILGSPVTEAWFWEGTIEFGDSATAKMLIPVRGRVRSGNLRAQAIKDGGKWRLTELTLELSEPDKHIDPLSKTEQPSDVQR